MLDTYNAIWWPAAASVTGIFLLRQHFYSVPKELEDAARVDGANRFRIYWQICLPLVRWRAGGALDLHLPRLVE